MRSYKRKPAIVCSAIIALTLAVNPFLANNTSYAAPTTTTTKAKVEQALKEYKAAQDDYTKLQKQIDDSDNQMKNTFQQLTKLREEQDATKKRLDAILVRLYTSGHSNMGAQLLGSKSFGEFLTRLEGIRLLMDSDYQVYLKFKEQEAAIKENQKKITEQVANSQKLLSESEKKVNQLKAQYTALQKQLKTEQEKELVKKSGVVDPNKYTDTSWVDKAKAMIGKVNYVFGGTTYPNFDCSGWVQYVFKQYRGINLPRTSSAQSKVGIPVSRNNLQRGDLIFLQGTYKSGVSHVGIYLGNGLYISNTNERTDLQIDSLNDSYTKLHYWGARRVN
jgi:cell wall-associated NlpC family hydrolase